MCYRFFMLAVVSIAMATVGVAPIQAREYDSTIWQNSDSGPVALMARASDVTPIPDGQADTGVATVQDDSIMMYGDGACSDNCGRDYTSPCISGPGFLSLPSTTSLSNFFLGTNQCYGGPCTSPFLFYKKQFVVESWIDQGFTWNPADPGNRSNLPVGFNDRANEYEMNQLYLVMERKIDDRKLWDWGARVDLLYGTDYIYTQAIGLETRSNRARRWNGPGPRNTGIAGDGGAALYGLSMPQLYAEFLTPMAYGTTVKVGHFYSIMGHESVMAPENFFYSHSYTMLYGEPFTFTGVLADYRYRPNFSVKMGIVRGWDTWDQPVQGGESVGRVGLLCGISWQSDDRRNALDLTVYTGEEQYGALDDQLQNRTNYSLVLKHDFSPRLTYVFQHDFGVQQAGTYTLRDQRAQQITTHWYSVANYLYYEMSQRMSIGCRLEWFTDPEYNRVLQLPSWTTTGGDYYEATVGINWKPFDRCVVRPELRWDWSNVTPRFSDGIYNEGSSKNQFTLGVDALYTF